MDPLTEATLGAQLAARGGETGTAAYAAAGKVPQPKTRGGTGAVQDKLHPHVAKGRVGGGQFATKSQKVQRAQVVKQPRTPAEIKAFQKSRGLPVTGKMDGRTATAIRNAQTAARVDAAANAGKGKGSKAKAAAAPAIKLGRGEYAKAGMGSPNHPDARVKKVQEALELLGYDVARDGAFGPELVGAVRQFQRDHHLPPTGVVTLDTLRRMDKKRAEIESGKSRDGFLSADEPATKGRRTGGARTAITRRGATGKVSTKGPPKINATNVILEGTERLLIASVDMPEGRATERLPGMVGRRLQERVTDFDRTEQLADRAGHNGGAMDTLNEAALDQFSWYEMSVQRLIMSGRPDAHAHVTTKHAGQWRFGGGFMERVDRGRHLFEAEVATLAADEALIEAADKTPEPFSHSKTSNWVARSGGLPNYIQHIAHDLMEKRGKSESQAIQMAIGIVKRWARGGGNVKPDTRAAAAKAVAQWEAMKAKARAT